MADWQTDLDDFLQQADQKQVNAEQEAAMKREQQSLAIDNFLASKVVPCFEQLQVVVEKRGRKVWMNKRGADLAAIEIKRTTEKGYTSVTELKYIVQVERQGDKLIAYPEINNNRQYFRSGAQKYTIDDLTQEEILQHLLQAYKSHVTRSQQ